MPKEERRNLCRLIIFSVAASLAVSLFHTWAVLEGPAEHSQCLARLRKRGQTARQSGVKARTKAKRKTVMVNADSSKAHFATFCSPCLEFCTHQSLTTYACAKLTLHMRILVIVCMLIGKFYTVIQHTFV